MTAHTNIHKYVWLEKWVDEYDSKPFLALLFDRFQAF